MSEIKTWSNRQCDAYAQGAPISESTAMRAEISDLRAALQASEARVARIRRQALDACNYIDALGGESGGFRVNIIAALEDTK